MQFSVVIPTFDSPVIDQTLAALRRQDFARGEFEVIVVGLDRPGLITCDELVRFDRTERPYGPAEARNRGAAQARGEIIAFLDSDCIPAADWLKTLAGCFARPEVARVGGGVAFEERDYWKTADNLAMFYQFLASLPPGPRLQFPSLNFAVRRRVFEEAGGFDTAYRYPAGEDFDLTYRISQRGHRLWFEPRAVIVHNPPRNSLAALWRHGYMMGQYSTKVDPRYRGKFGFPAWLRGQLRLLLAAPFLAAGVTWRVYRQIPLRWATLRLLPAVYLSKIAWCAGAAYSPLLKAGSA